MTDWKKSSFSAANGHCTEVRFRKATASEVNGCVEVASHCGVVDVRDSKDPDGGILTFIPDEWAAFIEGVKAGEFG
jgi:Domain of unknown function (DUF397)